MLGNDNPVIECHIIEEQPGTPCYSLIFLFFIIIIVGFFFFFFNAGSVLG